MWPYNGYLQELPRLAAELVQPLPLRLAPLIFNVIALAVQVLPVAFLLSRRFDSVVPSLSVRLAGALLYTGEPNSHEIDANLTNAQWHLALLAALLVAAVPRSWWTALLDLPLLALAGLTGPFSILLTPIALATSLRERRRLPAAAALALTGIVQLLVLPSARTGVRHYPAIGLQLADSRIFAGQVLVAGLIGNRGYRILHETSGWQRPALPLVLTLFGALLAAYALWRGTGFIRLLVVFAALLLGALVFGPQDSPAGPDLIADPRAGNRYYFLPILAFDAALLWLLVRTETRPLRLLAALCLALAVLVALPADWRYPPLDDSHFGDQVAMFNAAPSGETVVIAIDPPGWSMQLTKH